MRQMYNSLPSRSLDDGDFVSVSWLSAWLSDQDKLGSLDNSSLLCQHNRLNPEKFKEIKLISSTIVKMLYIFFSGPLFFLFCNVSFDVYFFIAGFNVVRSVWWRSTLAKGCFMFRLC